MKLSQFKYRLPAKLIAQKPLVDHDNDRLLVLHRKTGEIEHKLMADIYDYVSCGDAIVFNNAMVRPDLFYTKKASTGDTIEVILLRELNPERKIWDVLVNPARKIRLGNKLYFNDDCSVVAEIMDNTTAHGRTIRFISDDDNETFKADLFKCGLTPLPDYITRKPQREDNLWYKNVFASEPGALLAPAAGLHFSEIMMKRLELAGIKEAYITALCGFGNNRDIDSDELTRFTMDSELITVSRETADMINAVKDSNKGVCAVGISTLKAMVASETVGGHIHDFNDWVNKFICPPFEFNVPTSLLTNFQLPYSSSLMLVSAFGGYENVMKAHQTAVDKEYRFGIYGDALLIV